MMKSTLLFSFLFILFSPFSYSASFDCKQASTQVEKVICANQSLSQMDEVINTLYINALQKGVHKNIKSEQREWLKSRDLHCQSLYLCQKTFAQRIDQLTDRTVFAPNILTEGMTLPDLNRLDVESKAPFETEQLVSEKYRPWPRKVLLKESRSVWDPKAVVLGEEIYLYFIRLDAKNRTDWNLYEYRLTDKSYTKLGKTFNYYVEGNLIYFNTEQGGKVTKYAYTAGSAKDPAIVSQMDKWDHDSHGRAVIDRDGVAISHDNSRVAFTWDALNYVESLGGEASERGRLFTRAAKRVDELGLKAANTVVIYDGRTDAVTMMSDDELSEYWYINGINWSPDGQSVFFDNTGNWACIWEYRLAENTIHKIVPEHRAEAPYAFSYKGQDYIVYADYTDGREIKVAARPE